MRRISIFALAACLSLITCGPAAAYIIQQNNRCSTTFGNPACTYDVTTTCCYDATGCRSASCGSAGWDDCEEPHCPLYQEP